MIFSKFLTLLGHSGGLGTITFLKIGFYSVFKTSFYWILVILSRILWNHNEWSCNKYFLHPVQNLWAPLMIMKEGRPIFLFKLIFEICFSDALLTLEFIFGIFLVKLDRIVDAIREWKFQGENQEQQKFENFQSENDLITDSFETQQINRLL